MPKKTRAKSNPQSLKQSDANFSEPFFSKPSDFFRVADPGDPRTAMEQSESGDADVVPIYEVANALGRIVAWMLEGDSLRRVGLRAQIFAAKLRPDLTDGVSMAELGRRAKITPAAVRKITATFESEVYPYRGLNDKSVETRAKMAAAKGVPRACVLDHIALINKMCAWHAHATKHRLPVLRDRQQLVNDFAPVLKMLRDMAPGKESIGVFSQHR